MIYNASSFYVHASEYIADSLGAMAGRSVWIALGLFLLNRLVIRSKAMRTLSLYLVVAGIIFTIQQGQHLIEQKSARQAALNSLSQMSALANDAVAGKPIVPNTTTTDPLVQAISEFLQQLETETTEFAAQTEELPIAEMLAPKTLANSALTKYHIVKVQAFTARQEAHFQRIRDMQRDLTGEVQSLTSGVARSERFKKRVSIQLQRSFEANDEALRIRKRSMEVVLLMLEFVQRNREKCRFGDSQLTISDSKVLQEYNALLAELMSLSDRQVELQMTCPRFMYQPL